MAELPLKVAYVADANEIAISKAKKRVHAADFGGFWFYFKRNIFEDEPPQELLIYTGPNGARAWIAQTVCGAMTSQQTEIAVGELVADYCIPLFLFREMKFLPAWPRHEDREEECRLGVPLMVFKNQKLISSCWSPIRGFVEHERAVEISDVYADARLWGKGVRTLFRSGYFSVPIRLLGRKRVHGRKKKSRVEKK